MIKTITLGSCVMVQGIFTRVLADGRIAVQVGSKTFEGHPVERIAA